MVESSNIVDEDVVRGTKHSKENYTWFEEGRLQGAKEVYEDILNKMLGESTYPITIGYVKTKLKELKV